MVKVLPLCFLLLLVALPFTTRAQVEEEDDGEVDLVGTHGTSGPIEELELVGVEDLDEEEFEVPVKKPKPAQANIEQPKADQAVAAKMKDAAAALHDLEARPKRTWYLEAGYTAFIVIYLANFFIGRSKNQRIAAEWGKAASKVLSASFSKVGEGKNGAMVKESQHCYKMRASGRSACVGVEATLNLRKRHDLYSLMLELFGTGSDTMTIDIAMPDIAMENLVFLVIQKKEEKRCRRNFPDVAEFTKGPTSFPGLPENLCVCSEIEEVTAHFLTREVLVTLSNHAKMIEKIHFSDQGLLSTVHKKTLQVTFKLPKESEMDKITLLSKMAIHFIERMADLKLSKLGKQKSVDHRKKAYQKTMKESLEQRQEALQQKKLEKLQAEKARIELLPPDAQRKYEEKMQRKELKKRQSKSQKVKVVH